MILRGVSFFTPCSMILRGVSFFGTTVKFAYLSKNLAKIENIQTPWSVTQTGSNDTKTKVENIVGLSLKV